MRIEAANFAVRTLGELYTTINYSARAPNRRERLVGGLELVGSLMGLLPSTGRLNRQFDVRLRLRKIKNDINGALEGLENDDLSEAQINSALVQAALQVVELRRIFVNASQEAREVEKELMHVRRITSNSPTAEKNGAQANTVNPVPVAASVHTSPLTPRQQARAAAEELFKPKSQITDQPVKAAKESQSEISRRILDEIPDWHEKLRPLRDKLVQKVQEKRAQGETRRQILKTQREQEEDELLRKLKRESEIKPTGGSGGAGGEPPLLSDTQMANFTLHVRQLLEKYDSFRSRIPTIIEPDNFVLTRAPLLVYFKPYMPDTNLARAGIKAVQLHTPGAPRSPGLKKETSDYSVYVLENQLILGLPAREAQNAGKKEVLQKRAFSAIEHRLKLKVFDVTSAHGGFGYERSPKITFYWLLPTNKHSALPNLYLQYIGFPFSKTAQREVTPGAEVSRTEKLHNLRRSFDESIKPDLWVYDEAASQLVAEVEKTKVRQDKLLVDITSQRAELRSFDQLPTPTSLHGQRQLRNKRIILQERIIALEQEMSVAKKDEAVFHQKKLEVSRNRQKFIEQKREEWRTKTHD